MSDRDYKITLNVDTEDLEDGAELFFIRSLVEYIKQQLDKEFKTLPFKAEYHISFSRNA